MRERLKEHVDGLFVWMVALLDSFSLSVTDLLGVVGPVVVAPAPGGLWYD